jgi:phenylacetate-CoA ligase
MLQRDIAKSYKKYSSMKNMTYKEIEEYRLKKLKDLISYSYKYVPFYKNLWDSCNIKPEVKSLKDFEKFPIVDKKMLKKAIQD